MTTYTWTGSRMGQPASGTVEADTAMEARGQLEVQGVTVQTIEARKSGRKRAPKARINDTELAIFTRQMATMIGAGIPLLESLEIMAEQSEDEGFKHSLNAVVESVRTGNDLSEAMQAHPNVFAKIYINMIRAGEVSGQIDVILDRLAGYLEASAKLRGEIRAAMTYPVISLVLVLGIAIFLMTVVVPQFEAIFISLGAPLPGPTQMLLALSRSMTETWYWWLTGAVSMVVIYKLVKRTPKGARLIDRMFMRAPVFGPLVTKVALARFSRTFSTLLSSGVPILTALEIVASTCGNLLLEDAVLASRDNVQEGNDLSTPLAASGMIPPMVTRMIHIGEKSGALEELLDKVADFYDAQVESTVKALTSLIEPIMISVMGLIVGGIVTAIFLPIFLAPQHL